MDIKISVIIPVYNQEDLVLRAINSIPIRDDIEIIVIDDGSTDNTWANLISYRETCSLYMNLTLLYNKENKGVAYTVNRGYDTATGEYVVLLGSDDYFNTDEFIKAIDYLDGTDLVYFNLEKNDGSIWRLTNDNKKDLCGSVKFMKRTFIGDTRCPEDKRAGEDWFFYQDLLKKNPTEHFTDLNVKHYNFPRKGSLTDLLFTGRL
jgi:glycosyltransferase involved in cell wall biosynthesis